MSPTFSIISQLGFVPEDLPFDALEVRDSDRKEDLLPFILSKGIPFVSFSDAHYLKDIGKRRTCLQLEKADFSEIKRALQGLRKCAPTMETNVSI